MFVEAGSQETGVGVGGSAVPLRKHLFVVCLEEMARQRFLKLEIRSGV